MVNTCLCIRWKSCVLSMKRFTTTSSTISGAVTGSGRRKTAFIKPSMTRRNGLLLLRCFSTFIFFIRYIFIVAFVMRFIVFAILQSASFARHSIRQRRYHSQYNSLGCLQQINHLIVC